MFRLTANQLFFLGWFTVTKLPRFENRNELKTSSQRFLPRELQGRNVVEGSYDHHQVLGFRRTDRTRLHSHFIIRHCSYLIPRTGHWFRMRASQNHKNTLM